MTFSNLPGNLSPKIAAVLAALGGPGIILLILGFALKDDTLKTAGVTLLAGGAAATGAGYKAPVGDVVEEVGEGSDDGLLPEVAAKLNNTLPA